MLCAPEVTDERLTLHMQCNEFLRSTDSRLSEVNKDQLIHGPVYAFPENRDTKFSGFPLGHCSDWNFARYSSSIQDRNRTSYWTSGAAVTEGFELLSPQPTNEKNMQDQDIPLKPLPSEGNTLGQHRHRKKVKNSLTTCPTCHVVASTSSGLIAAPLISDSDILHHDGKPPKSSSKKRRNKSKQCRRAIHENLNLLPELLHEEQLDAASPAEVLLPDLLTDKLSDTSSSASSLVKDTHLGKDSAERHNEYVERRPTLTLCTLESDRKDGPGCTGSSNITTGERLGCKCVPYSNDGPNTADSSEPGGSAVTEHVYSYVGEESNCCQKSSCACVCNSSVATADSFFKVRNSDNCANCGIDSERRLAIIDEDKQDSFQHGASTGLDSVKKACHLTGLHLSSTHAEDDTDNSSHTERVQCSSEACSSKLFVPVSSGRRGRRSRETSSCNNSTATNRVVGANRQRRSGKDSGISVWQKVEKLNKEKSSGAAGHAAVSSGLEHHANRPTGKHRCKKSCKHHHSSRNYYAPKNHLPQAEGLSSMLQLACARDASDRRSGAAVTEEASVAPYDLDSHSVPQGTSEQACTLGIRDGTHSLCVENEAIPTDLDPRNLCADPCIAELVENQGVKSYSAAAHMSHKWVPIGKKDKIHLDVLEASVLEASVPANDIDVERTVSDVPASTKCEGSELFSTDETAKLSASAQPYSKCQGHIETGKTAFSKIITEAVRDAYMAQQRAEDIQLLIGRPLADFEQFIYSASPVLHCTPCPTGCNSSSQERVRDRLCSHRTADISLSSIWQWYEEPGCYGLEVKAQDLRRLNGFWSSHCQFNAYFVPYLSAVQLFAQAKRTTGKDAAGTGGARSPCLSSLPILAKLLPKETSNQRYSPSGLHINDDQQAETTELLFEFFESEQPFWRRQLFDKVKELIDGAKQSNCQMSGDPKNLELSLHDLHPASWYCVAWYPIYRIPDGKFQAAFLTYHSLGHWVHRRSASDQAGHSHAVLPVVGLQSYNDKGEWWFQTSRSSSEDADSTDSSCSQVLRERLSTLKQAAAAMARADVPSKDQTRSRNRHPDYEFFLSRSR